MERDEIFHQVGQALRVARRRRGLSQRAFAAELGVGKSYLARLEVGEGMAGISRVQRVLFDSGFTLAVVDREPERGLDEELNEHIADAGGRRFPAHVEVEPIEIPPLHWYPKHGGWLSAAPRPFWTWHRRAG
jgi:transcriptional regulator with XRE-family HTH domain